jgi:hypothetical protein
MTATPNALQLIKFAWQSPEPTARLVFRSASRFTWQTGCAQFLTVTQLNIMRYKIELNQKS